MLSVRTQDVQSLLNPKEAAVIFVVRTIVIFSVSNSYVYLNTVYYRCPCVTCTSSIWTYPFMMKSSKIDSYNFLDCIWMKSWGVTTHTNKTSLVVHSHTSKVLFWNVLLINYH